MLNRRKTFKTTGHPETSETESKDLLITAYNCFNTKTFNYHYQFIIHYICYMLSKNEIKNKLKELKPLLYSDYAVKEIGIFDSFSDGTFNEESDIDILIELERPIGWKFFSLELFLEKFFNRKIDLVTKNALKEQIKESILNQVDYIK
ncbi:nucleotidyltransferase family protein [Bacteroidota bacterium]